jgi:hypothetical protein
MSVGLVLGAWCLVLDGDATVSRVLGVPYMTSL